MELLEEINKIDQDKAQFQAIAGDIDIRDDTLKDMELQPGFYSIQCGLRGSKLSGG